MWYYLLSALGGQVFSSLVLWLSGFFVGLKASLTTVLSVALVIGGLSGIVVCLIIEYIYNKWIKTSDTTKTINPKKSNIKVQPTKKLPKITKLVKRIKK